MSDEVWEEVFVAVVSGVIISLVMWLLRGTFNLIASHPWLIMIAGLGAAAVIAISRYLWLEKPVTFFEDRFYDDCAEGDYFDLDGDDYCGYDEGDTEEGDFGDEDW